MQIDDMISLEAFPRVKMKHMTVRVTVKMQQ